MSRGIVNIYTDEERAKAVALLEANGYPDVKGALKQTSDAIGIPSRTISRWFNGEQNPPPDQTVTEKKIDLQSAIENELDSVFKAMGSKRSDASYRDLTTAFGVLADKLILLSGNVTARIGFEDRNTAIDSIAEKLSALNVSGDTKAISSDTD